MRKFLPLFILSFFLVYSCKEKKTDTKEIANGTPSWAKNASMYEVNIRQYTPEGTFKAFEAHIPRLKELGIDILWLMPIHPIGELNRKGSLGSYYSIKDYKAVNPEFGSLDDFKSLVKTAHDNGMKLIIDWVGNHSSWDHEWVKTHPEYYKKDSTGKLLSPYDWTDVVALDYSNKELNQEMIDIMKYWIEECGIDGYRCDVAFMVPNHFWLEARKSLDSIKPVFMLAESEEINHHDSGFDATYAWEFMHINNEIAKGKKNVFDLVNYLKKQDTSFKESAYRLSFVTNHDENSWNGTEYERYGKAVRPFTVLAYTLAGMPLVYSGQEAGLNKRLKFFDKDSIDFSQLTEQTFIQNILKLKKKEPALDNIGSKPEIIYADSLNRLVYLRKSGNSEVWVQLNFGENESPIVWNKYPSSEMIELFSKEKKSFSNNSAQEIKAYSYQIWIKP